MSVSIIVGDAREVLAGMPDASVHCVVTSPPYFGLRKYGDDQAEIGREPTPAEFVEAIVAVFREVRRVMRPDATLWLNLGDAYAGSGKGGNPGHSAHVKQRRNAGSLTVRGRKVDCGEGFKPKDLIGIPWMVAFALREDGWFLRQENIWSKPNAMPESTKDRTTRAHETVFMLSKSARYFYDPKASAEPAVTIRPKKWTDGRADKQRGHSRRHAGFNGRYAERIAAEGVPETRNRRSVWSIATSSFRGAHFATFPPALAEICILAGCPLGGTVMDPFFGAGTTGLVAQRLGRDCIGIDLYPANAVLARERIDADAGLFARAAE